MSKRNKIIPAIAVAGFLAIGAIAAGAAGAANGSTATAPTAISTSGLTGVTDTTTQQVTSASQASAASGDPGTKPGARCGHGDFGNALDALVTDGTITAAQQTKIADAYKTQEANDTDAQEQLEHSDRAAWLDLILDPLVKDGTLTSDQAAKVKTALSAARGGGPGWGRGPGQGRGPGRDRGGDHGAPAQGSQNG